MKKTIAILCPMKSSGYEANFQLVFKKSHQPLTFENFYSLIKNSYVVNTVAKQDASYFLSEGNLSAAGYYLSGLLREHGYDTIASNRCDETILQKIASATPLAICISTTLLVDVGELKKIVNRVRNVMPEVFIIIGGILVWKSYCWIDLLQRKPEIMNNKFVQNTPLHYYSIFPCHQSEINADVFVASPHGAQILLKILEELERGNKAEIEKIPNLAVAANDGKFFFTERIEEPVDYENDFTRWDLVDNLPASIPSRTSRGCPYRCGFCDYCHIAPKIVLRSPESLLKELSLIKKLLKDNPQCTRLDFVDDNIFITPKRVTEVSNALFTSGIGLFWRAFVRASSITPTNIEILRKSGMVAAGIGMESGDEEQLQRMNKKQNLADCKHGIELLDKANVHALLSFVIGYPGETEASIKNTADFLNNLSVSFTVYRLYPFLLAPLSSVSYPEMREKFNLYGMEDTWSHYTMDSSQTTEYCYQLFKNVDNISIVYPTENPYFLMRFGYKQQKLKQLRHQLTIQLIEDDKWENITRTFLQISELMGIEERKVPPANFRDELLVPLQDKIQIWE